MQESRSRKRLFAEGAAAEDSMLIVEKKPSEKKKFDGGTEDKEGQEKSVRVEDIFDAFAGYLPGQVNFMPRDKGKCVICGKETMSSMRKICIGCLSNNGRKLYKKAKEAINSGDKTITVVI